MGPQSFKEWALEFFHSNQKTLEEFFPGINPEVFLRHVSAILQHKNPLLDLSGAVINLSAQERWQLQDDWLKGVPWAYQLGFKYFFNSKISLESGVLIPRNETELILELFEKFKPNPLLKIWDVCSGPGTIGLGVLNFISSPVELHFFDISPLAISLAQKNYWFAQNQFHPGTRVIFHLGDFLQMNKGEKAQMILANPPYIPLSMSHQVHQQVMTYEPKSALFLQDEEYDQWYDQFFSICSEALDPSGVLILEGHEDCLDKLKTQVLNSGFKNPQLAKDLSGRLRFLITTKGA